MILCNNKQSGTFIDECSVTHWNNNVVKIYLKLSAHEHKAD